MSITPAVVVSASETVEALRDKAHSQVAQYPQYKREAFNAYVKARIKKRIRRRGNGYVMFERGDVVLLRDEPADEGFVTVWSFRAAIDTSIKASDVERIG